MRICAIADLEEIKRPDELIKKYRELEEKYDDSSYEFNPKAANKAKRDLDSFLEALPFGKAVLEHFKYEYDGNKAYKIDNGGYLLIDEYDNYSSNRGLVIIGNQVFIGDETELIVLRLIKNQNTEIKRLNDRIDNLRIR